MSMLMDWMFIITTTLIAFRSYRRIVRNRYSSVAHFIVLVEYIFLCIPILLNYCMGIPTYEYVPWYKSFLPSMKDATIAVIYDLYILVSIGFLYGYARKFDGKNARFREYDIAQFNGLFDNKVFLIVVILSPLIYIVISGNFMLFLIYATSAGRGINGGNFTVIIYALMLFSIYAFCYWFFSKPISFRRFVVLLVYSIAIAWINGKRFVIALMLLVYLFFYTRSDIDKKARKRIETLTPILFLSLIAFSYFYLVVIKPLTNVSFDSVYDMLRVDFGRDDVVKFVIEQEFFKKEPILAYRGQSFLSTFLTFVPRKIWPNKPYPHYMYLTSRILGTAIDRLPAGTTPSWFELCIANFSWLGFAVGAFSIPMFCKWCDKLKSIPRQMLVLVFIMVLITQSMDAYVAFLLLIIAQYVIKHMMIGKRIVISKKKRCE